MSALDNLTEKQRRFVEAYVGEACGNATEAARLAGYDGNDNTVRSVGCENLTKPAVAAAIEELQAERAAKATMTRQQREELLAKLARGEVDEPTVLKNGDIVYAPVKGVVRRAAIETLGKMYGDYLERREITGGLQVVRVVVPANERVPEKEGT